MTYTAQNAEIYAGDSAVLNVTMTDVNGNPYALSPGGTIKWWAGYTSHDAEPLIAKELNAGIIMDGNVAEITLTPDDTLLEPGLYYHEIRVYDLNDVATAMTGTLVVRRALDMTRELPLANLLAGESALVADGTVVP